MDRLHMSNSAFLMSFKVSQREVERLVSRLDIEPADDFPVTDSEEARVAAVQLMLKRYDSLADYVVDMNLYVSDAVNRRAQVVCFPAYAGLLPAGFLPQSDAILESLRPDEETGLPDLETLGDVLACFSDCVFDAYYFTMSALAAKHNVAIMAGSTLCFDQDSLCHRAFLFGPDGEMLGYQDKLSLNKLEQALRLDAADELKVFDSPVGAVAILTGEDANYYETARIAKALGAKILLHPAAIREEYTPQRATLGLNMRAQENTLYGVQSVLVGDTGLGFALEGASSIFGPSELSKALNGVIARGSGRYEPDVLCMTLSLERLAQIRNPYRQDRNVEFLEKYIDRLY